MIWLISKNGMLGSEVDRLFKNRKILYVATGSNIDIIDYQLLKNFTKNKKISWIVNCSGYTSVSKAEKEPQRAYNINCDGVKNIAFIAQEKKAKLIHISTDYIFDGEKCKNYFYVEKEKPNPINVYGKSKLAGELEILKVMQNYIIIRTAWLYGLNGNNFVYTMLKLFKEKKEVKIVNDQWGTPTFTRDLAETLYRVIKNDSKNYGVYNFTNEGNATWYLFAKEIYIQAKKRGIINPKKETKLIPVKAKEYNDGVKRPSNSILSTKKIIQTFPIRTRNWKQALGEFLAR